MCEVLDPINATTGNYYYEGRDFTIKDFEDVEFLRYYNSIGPKLSNIFGNVYNVIIDDNIGVIVDGELIFIKI